MDKTGYSSDVAFTPTGKAVQTRRGSRRAYARMEEKGSWQMCIAPDLAEFIAAQTSIFIATANNTELTATLMPEGYKARPEQAILFLESPLGTRIAPSTSPSGSTPPLLPLHSRSATSASRHWKPS
jgi:hypothetical protein